MTMHGLVLAAFAAIILAPEVGAPLIPGFEQVAFASFIATAISLLLAFWAFAALQIRRLSRFGRICHLHRLEFATTSVRWILLGLHLVGVVLFGMTAAVRDWVGDIVVLDELLTALPFLAALVATEFVVYPMERRIRDAMTIRNLDLGRPIHAFPQRLRYTWLWARHNVFFMLVPLVLLAAWMEATARFLPRDAAGSFAGAGLQIVGVILVFSLIPPLLVSVWDTVRLGSGPLRDDLERLARDSGVGLRAILVWRTGGAMLNGAAIGLIRPLRYVVLTDGLLDALEPIEIQSVAAHELAHMRCRHMLWLGIGVIGTVLLAGTPLGWLTLLVAPDSLIEKAVLATGLTITLIAAIGVLAFASRRFEREADAWATARVTALDLAANTPTSTIRIEQHSALAMASALSRVAEAHGMPVERPTLRHGSIARRQQFLLRSIGQVYRELPAIRAARSARVTLIAILAGGLAIAGVDVLLRLTGL